MFAAFVALPKTGSVGVGFRCLGQVFVWQGVLVGARRDEGEGGDGTVAVDGIEAFAAAAARGIDVNGFSRSERLQPFEEGEDAAVAFVGRFWIGANTLCRVFWGRSMVDAHITTASGCFPEKGMTFRPVDQREMKEASFRFRFRNATCLGRARIFLGRLRELEGKLEQGNCIRMEIVGLTVLRHLYGGVIHPLAQ